MHGIGTQPRCETLVRWGDALVDVLAAVRCPRAATAGPEPLLRVLVEEARAGDGTSGEPAEATLLLCDADGGEERWLLVEGWWADAFPPPTYRELVSWSVRAAPWSIVLHVAQRYWHSARAGSTWVRGWALARAIVEVLLALAMSPLLVALLTATLLVGALPVPQLRSLILAVQSALTATVGDSLAFVESPLRAALVRSRVRAALARLAEHCERTVVVAHSQGAAVVLEALGGMGDAPAQEVAARQPPVPPPHTMITLGAGINKLVALREAHRFDQRKEGNPVTRALWALLAAVIVGGWLVLAFLGGSLDGVALLRSVVALAVVLAGVALLPALVERGLKVRPAWRRSPWAARVLAGYLVAAAIAIYLAAERFAPALWPLYFLTMALAFLWIALGTLLREETRVQLAEGVRRPPGVECWVDVYAVADPVPNGRTWVCKGNEIESVRIWSEGSTFADHTSYWRNRDEFVLRVVRECAAAAGSPWVAALPRPDAADGGSGRAALRVGDLWRARWLNRLLWLGVLALGWSAFRELIPRLEGLPAGLPLWVAEAVRSLVLVACAAAAILVTSALLRWTWRRWVRAEQDALLAGRAPEEAASWRLLALMAMGVLLCVPTAVALLLIDVGRRGMTLAAWGREVAGTLLAGGASAWAEIALASLGVVLGLIGCATIFSFLLLAGAAVWRRLRPAT